MVESNTQELISSEEISYLEELIFPLFEKLNSYSDIMLEKWAIPFDKFESIRIQNAFNRAKIITYLDLKKYGLKKTATIPWLGRKSFKALVNVCLKDLQHENLNESTKLDINVDIYEKFLSRLSSIITDLINQPIESGFNGKDYSLEQTQIRQCVFNYGISILNGRQLDVFIRRCDLNAKESLQQIGDCYNLTRERIRQIELKALKKVSSRFANPSHYDFSQFVEDFYTYLLELPYDELINYLSFSKSKNDIDWYILRKLIEKRTGNLVNIPKYRMPKSDPKGILERIKEKEPELESFSTRNNKLTLDQFSSDELKILTAIQIISSIMIATPKKIFLFLTGNLEELVYCKYYNSYTDLSLNNLYCVLEQLKNKKVVLMTNYMSTTIIKLTENLDFLDDKNENCSSFVINENDYAIIKCVKSLNSKFGIQTFASLLVGCHNDKIKKLEEHPYYGIFKGLCKKDYLVKRMVGLVVCEYLIISKGQYKVLSITQKGSNLIEGINLGKGSNI